MGSRSKRLQFYGVGVPWGQRPHSTPGGEVVWLDMNPSKWWGSAGENAISTGLPAAVSRSITPSSWLGAAGSNPLLAIAVDTEIRDLTPSAWTAHASGNPIETALVEDVAVELTPSVWNGHASGSVLVAANITCCERVYEPRRACRTYESVCCEED